MPNFYDGKRFFLTYAQCNETKEDLLEFFQSKGELAYYVIAREEHKVEGLHLHACIEFKHKIGKNKRYLDFKGKHPNKQDPRKWAATCQYTKKDGDFIESERRVELDVNLEEVLALSGSETEWMQYCVNNKITFQYARWYWDRFAQSEASLNDEDYPGTICDVLSKLQFDPNCNKALVIRGPSGCGKTTWAKKNCPKPALFVSHIDQLKKFLIGFHKSIVFDDVSFCHFPRTSQIHLLDFDNTRAIHCRHSIATIPAGVYKIFTCNEWPVSRGDPAIERRMRCVNVTI